MTTRMAASVRTAMRRLHTVIALTTRTSAGTLCWYTVLTLVAGAMPVGTAWLTKEMLDGLVRGVAVTMLVGLGLGIAAAGTIIAIGPQVARYLRGQLDRQVGLLVQDRLFTALDGFTGLARFEDPEFLDRLRLAQQAGGTTVSQAVDCGLSVAAATITITGFLGSLFVLNPVMSLLVLVSGVPTLCAELTLSRRRARTLWTVGSIERREFFYSRLLSSIEAAKEVRLFGIGGFLRERMLAGRRSANIVRRDMDIREVRIESVLGLLAAGMSGAGLLWAVLTARTGALSVGGVTMFVGAVAGVQGALATLAIQLAQAQQTLLLLDHYLAVTTAGPDLTITARPRSLSLLRQGIELRNVWFRYSADHPWVLRGVNLHLWHGKTLALVGLNGAGKSTLVKLLCRFYDPTHGAILWDGVDIRDVDVTELRQRIGAAFQDYMHYDMTAAENIGLGDLAAFYDRTKIESAADRAGLHTQLSALPRGYDTPLTRIFFMESDKDNPETGVVLSGGQWQRLALARAFLRDRRDLMILDEPSSGLDAEAEHEIHTALRQHRCGRTSLLISHRLGAVRDADEIVVLSKGRIVEQGDHRTLIAEGGEYARLFSLQASGYRLEPARS